VENEAQVMSKIGGDGYFLRQDVVEGVDYFGDFQRNEGFLEDVARTYSRADPLGGLTRKDWGATLRLVSGCMLLGEGYNSL
jgi:hypothetical protein